VWYPERHFLRFFSLFCFFIAMPLPDPNRCVRAHHRRIEVEGFLRDDGLFDLDARLTDLKDIDYPLSSGVRKRGDPSTTCSSRDHRPPVQHRRRGGLSDWVPYPAPATPSGPPIAS
jgi:hypothetical protein